MTEPADPASPPVPPSDAPLQARRATTLLMIRHAPADDRGRLAGRRDVPAAVDAGAAAALAALAGPVDRVVASPALRCRLTAAALWPGADVDQDERLWEQDFGAWEGAAYDHLPDLGPMSAAELARTAPPGGESFAALCARTIPALEDLAAAGGRIAVVAHAGTVRTALARAMDSPAAALAFRISPLSLTVVEASDAGWAVAFVNRTAA